MQRTPSALSDLRSLIPRRQRPVRLRSSRRVRRWARSSPPFLLAFCALCFAVDVTVAPLAGVIWGAPLLFASVIVAWLQVSSRLFRGKDLSTSLEVRRGLLRPALLGALVATSGCLFEVNTRHASASAERLIAAIEAFAEEEGRYPDELSELVPGYLPEIPPVVITPRVQGGFRYTGPRTFAARAPATPSLTWTPVLTYDRRVHRFRRRPPERAEEGAPTR